MQKLTIVIIALLGALCFMSCNNTSTIDDRYVVLASESVANDDAWMAVAHALSDKHSADIITYNSSLVELIDTLRVLNPRYVAIVEQPENIGRDFVIEFNLASRTIDEDIYADFFWAS